MGMFRYKDYSECWWFWKTCAGHLCWELGPTEKKKQNRRLKCWKLVELAEILSSYLFLLTSLHERRKVNKLLILDHM